MLVDDDGVDVKTTTSYDLDGVFPSALTLEIKSKSVVILFIIRYMTLYRYQPANYVGKITGMV